MQFETVTKKIDLAEGEVAAYDVCETWVGLAEVDGQVYAIGDLCTHAGCSLAKGQLEGTTVTCSCHGSQFDVTTGEVLKGPATEPVPSYRVKIERGVDSAWLALEEGQIVRYDHLDLPVGPDGRATWQGRTYARAEVGTATVSRVLGSVDAVPGDGLSYQVLRSQGDDRAWLSVETWNSGFVEVSAGRLWPVDKIVTGAGSR